MQIKGIDISHWQGKVDFNLVTASESFVIMKVSQMTSVDSMFNTYYNGIANRVPVGVYIYNKAKTISSAIEEAKTAIKALAGKKIPLGVWLDMEDSTLKNLSKQALTNIIEAEATLLKEAGFDVGIYCNYSWYNSVLDSQKLAEKYPFWIARYPSIDNGTIKESLSPEGKKNVVMWQYSSKGRTPGIGGNVDKNVCFDLLTNIYGSKSTPTIGYKGVLPTLPSRGYFKKGDSGENVKRLQNFLNYAVPATLTADGIMGAKTISSVIDFQHRYGLAEDGLFGRDCLRKAETLR